MKRKRQRTVSKGRANRSCGRWLSPAVSLAFLLAAGCGSRAGREQPKPIAECQEYEKVLARCTGRSEAVATHPSVLASSEEQRARLKALCGTNIQRLKAACH